MYRLNYYINNKQALCAIQASKFLLCFVLLFFIFGCKEEFNKPIEAGQEVPGMVQNVHVIPTPGGADLVYDLPSDSHLSYVEALVEISDHEKLNFKSSSYRDTINITGLASTALQEVKLYSVSKSGVRSDPVIVHIEPLTPPYLRVFETMTLSSGLGGVDVRFENQSGSDLAFFLGTINDQGEFEELDSHYTKDIDGRILFWGYPPEEKRFGVYIRDRWNHYSDTSYADIKPVLEVMLDKKKFKGVMLINDTEQSNDYYNNAGNLWDGIWSGAFESPYSGNGNDWRHLSVYGTLDEPGTFTIDLGQVANISRIRMNHYYPFSQYAPKKYEVYGLVDYTESTLPIGMGAWHNWTLLSEVENVKPSDRGGDAGDDKTSWEAGDIITLNPPSQAIRYIRFKVKESWDGRENISLAEVSVFGQPIE
ncbi:DUF4959 domain-containing protein [Sphingobacterium sp. UT-1RO-CII-1]|uniref:DUF4959 domain-containing protein n=1 Tax=Sphingobacterium sp. UT-1RO-CII-1 TaxID=2995225 RepID=UPI00227A1CBA|nr:DUF4959 domain-containing protein [Sphingobacterium sp. UT-1RO-CII-1]MCY4779150.1 DUF4959 domain-containing protein [Sphingobacterium sp. UT-1RO-CII-1]